MKDERLKPCPLCGREVELAECWVRNFNRGREYTATVKCDCGVSFVKTWTEYASAEDSVITDKNIFDAWNERADTVIRCRECRFCYVNPILRTFRCHRFMAVVNANDFCIYGERRPEK